jgi:polyribonucleotide nucleotidyltransferase
MGAVCGSTLSLMDAGVPIKAPVAGIAMGLVMGDDGRYSVLTDIIGMEDALGDMDFKVAGTREGITALQMDIKTKEITPDIIRDALAQAREARLFVLDKMLETIPEARSELSRWAPRMYRLQISPEKIGTVIGPGGRVIRSIIEETKCTIDVEDDGAVFIGSTSEEAARKAIEIIEGLTKDVEVGKIYTGKVTRLMNFGAFVEIMPGKEGLIHISELADYRVPSVEDVVQVGDEVMVLVTEIDSLGRINLSRRAVLEQEGQPVTAGPPQPSERPPAPNRFRRESGPRRGDGRPTPGGQAGGEDRSRRRRRPPRRRGGGGGAPPQREDSGPPPPPPPPRPNLGGRY